MPNETSFISIPDRSDSGSNLPEPLHSALFRARSADVSSGTHEMNVNCGPGMVLTMPSVSQLMCAEFEARQYLNMP